MGTERSPGATPVEETEGPEAVDGTPSDDAQGHTDPPSPADDPYDSVDEASNDSFPASDAPSFWGR